MKAYIISLGCPKNLVDTESLMSLLKAEGYSFTPNPKEADLILVNTCAFIQSAKEEAVNTILEMAKYKKTGKCKQLIVAGCLSQRYKKELPKLLPEVDAFIGTPWKFKAQAKAQVSPWTAYVKISEGCNNRCSYCTIPDIRGPLRHRSQTDILKEIKSLVQKGVREIIFIAQDTTAYPKFHLLLKKAAKIKGVRWIRILYAHPAHLTDQVIETIASEPKIVKYLDLPIQHVSDKILKEMNRHYGRSDLEKLISKIRRRIPKIALRTSVIVGFPGESELEFKELFDFIKKTRFERLGVFEYSREEGTPAHEMRGQVSKKEKKSRFQKLMRAQACISRELNNKLIGTNLNVLIEKEMANGLIGRSYMDAPEIDGSVLVRSKSVKPGEIKRVRITKASTYDLIGKLT